MRVLFRVCRRWRRPGLCLAAACLALMLGGCGFGMEVDNLMQAPRPAGEYRDIQAALESYVQARHKEDGQGANYTLKYPRCEGDNRSAFFIEDMDGDGEAEAFVLYQRGAKSTNAHLLYLRKTDGVWAAANDIEGEGPGIDRIEFTSLTGGRGSNLLLAGWSTGVGKSLVLYRISAGKLDARKLAVTTYLEWAVADFRHTGSNDLMLFYAEGEGENRTVKAGLFNYGDDGNMWPYNYILLDKDIQSLVNLTTVPLPSGGAGIYADARRLTGMLTELVYWDGETGQLMAPLSSMTFREDAVASMRIEGDDRLSWPQIRQQSIAPPTDRWNNTGTLPVTVWRSWDFDNHRVSGSPLYTLMNWQDGYYLRLNDERLMDMTGDTPEFRVTAVYEEKTRSMHVYACADKQVGAPIIVIRAVHAADPRPMPKDDEGQAYTMQPLAAFESVSFQIWFTRGEEYGFNLEQLQRIINFL